MSDARREVTINLNLTGADISGVVKAKEALTAAHEVKKDLEQPIKLDFDATALTSVTEGFVKMRDASVDAVTAISGTASGVTEELSHVVNTMHEGVTAADEMKTSAKGVADELSRDMPDPFQFWSGLKERIKEAKTLLEYNSEISASVREYIRESEKASGKTVSSEDEYKMVEQVGQELREQWEAQRASTEAQALLEEGLAEEGRKNREDVIADIREQGEELKRQAEERLKAIHQEGEARRSVVDTDAQTIHAKATLEALEDVAKKNLEVKKSAEETEEALDRVMASSFSISRPNKSSKEASATTAADTAKTDDKNKLSFTVLDKKQFADLNAELNKFERQAAESQSRTAALRVEIRRMLEEGKGEAEIANLAHRYGRRVAENTKIAADATEAVKQYKDAKKEALSIARKEQVEINKSERARKKAAKEAEAAVKEEEQATAKANATRRQAIQSYAAMGTSVISVAANLRFLTSESESIEQLAEDFAYLQSTMMLVRDGAIGIVDAVEWIDSLSLATRNAAEASAATVGPLTKQAAAQTTATAAAQGATAATAASAASLGTLATAGLAATPVVLGLGGLYYSYTLRLDEANKAAKAGVAVTKRQTEAYTEQLAVLKSSLALEKERKAFRDQFREEPVTVAEIEDNRLKGLESSENVFSETLKTAFQEAQQALREARPEDAAEYDALKRELGRNLAGTEFIADKLARANFGAFTREDRRGVIENRLDELESKIGLKGLEQQRELVLAPDATAGDIADFAEFVPAAVGLRDTLVDLERTQRQANQEAIDSARNSQRQAESESARFRDEALSLGSEINQLTEIQRSRERFESDATEVTELDRLVTTATEAQKSGGIGFEQAIGNLSGFLRSNNLVTEKDIRDANQSDDRLASLQQSLVERKEFGDDQEEQALEASLEAAAESQQRYDRLVERFKDYIREQEQREQRLEEIVAEMDRRLRR